MLQSDFRKYFAYIVEYISIAMSLTALTGFILRFQFRNLAEYFIIVTIFFISYPFLVLICLFICHFRKPGTIGRGAKLKLSLRKVMFAIFVILLFLLLSCSIFYIFYVLSSYYDSFIGLLFLLIFIYFLVGSLLYIKNYRGRILLIYFAPLIIFLICGVAYYSHITSTVMQYEDPVELANYVNDLIRRHTVWCYHGCPFKELGQVEHVISWVLFGYARCGGSASVAKALLERGGLKAYLASFPGEDRAFVIANISGELYSIDPGYFENITSIECRIKRRILEYGNITYVAMHLDEGGFIELTSFFPKLIRYDTIVIKVLKNNMPVANACVELRHKFGGRIVSIPGNERCFHTNPEGEIIVHLGPPKYYAKKAGDYEPYFWIYVNRENTGITVTSTGTFTIKYVTVTLP